MVNNEANKVVTGALLLSIAGLFSKVLSAGYRIPLQNLTGDFGFYVYQQIYPILGIGIILALYGFPVAVSRLTAELNVENKHLSLQSFYKPILLILFGINGLILLIIYINAGVIAKLVGDEQLTTAYRYAAFIFLLIPFTSLLRGIFQGYTYMLPTAISQVGEQIVRVLIIISSAYLVFNGTIHPYTIGKFGAISSVIGSVVAFIILCFFFLIKKPFDSFKISVPWKHYIRTIILFGMIASLNHMILLILQLADVFTLIPSLIKSGMSPTQAMEAKGVFDRGQPLIQLGTVLGSSFALALIPNITKENLQKSRKKLFQSVKSALAITIYISVAATIGLVFIFPEANVLLYQNDKGTFSLQILAIVILLSPLTITFTSILQGLGYLKQTTTYIFFAFIVKWFLNKLLVPKLAITGSAIATVISMVILFILMLRLMKRVFPEFKLLEVIQFKAIIIAIIGLITSILFIHLAIPYTLIQKRTILLLYVMSIIMVGAFLYIFLLFKCKAFTEKERSMLPFSSIFTRRRKGRDPIDR